MRAKEYYRASSLEDAYQKLQEDSKNVLLAGGLWIKKMGQSYNTLIDLSTLGLNKISEKENEIIVGAMVTQRDFENSPIIRGLFNDALAFSVREVMGVNFRNLATIGGSIMGRYPFSDVISGLLAYPVTLKFYPEQEMSLEEYLNFKGKLNAILTEIHIKKVNGKGYFKKVKTTALDFPILNISISKIENKFTIVIGARPMVAAISKNASEYISNISNPKEEDFIKASELAIEELIFMDNKDASKEYRLDLAKVYVKRGLKEVNE